MTEQTPDPPAADVRHWRASRRAALWLGGAWFVIAFGPLLFARQLDWEVLGAPLVFWICAQFAPVLFVLLVWCFERIANRLDGERRAQRVGR